MKRFITYLLCCMALAIISLSLNSCKYHGRNEDIPDMHGTLEESRDTAEIGPLQDSIKQVNIKNAEEQSKKELRTEHRVYYVDYSYSMVSGENENAKIKDKSTGKLIQTGTTLLQLVKDSLQTSIPKIKGQKVRIEIIPFLDKELWDLGEKRCFEIDLDSNSKGDLKKMEEFISTIHEIERSKPVPGIKPDYYHYNTHHSIAVEDFLNNRISNDKEYHIMILLTDGKDEYDRKDNTRNVVSAIEYINSKWFEKTKGKYAYGVFADLTNGSLKGTNTAQYFNVNGKKGLRYEEYGLNFNYSVSLLISPKPVDLRSHSFAYIAFPHSGSVPKIKFANGSESFSDGIYEYTIENQPDEKSKFITLCLKSLKEIKDRPELHKAKLTFKFEYDSNTIQLINECDVELAIVDKKTPNIDFKLPDHEDEDQSVSFETDLQYCKKFLGTIAPEWTDTMNLKFSYEKSQDAKHINPKLKIKGLPKCVKILYHGETFDSCEITLDTDQGTDSLSFIVDTSLKDLDGDIICKDGSIEIVCGDLLHVYANDYPINNDNRSHKIASFRINVDEHCHPIEIIIWCLGALLLLLLLFALLWRLSRPRFLGGNRYIYFEHSQRGNEARYIFYVINGAGLMIDGSEDNSVMTCKLSHKLVNSIVVGPESERSKYHSKWILNGKNVFVNCNFINDFKNVRRIEIKPVFLDGTNFILKFIFGWKFIPYSRDEHIGIRVRIIMDDGVSTVYTAQVNMTEFNTGQSVRDSFRSENDNGNHNIDQWLLIGVLNMQAGNNIQNVNIINN